jgi:hypothetical protein
VLDDRPRWLDAGGLVGAPAGIWVRRRRTRHIASWASSHEDLSAGALSGLPVSWSEAQAIAASSSS